MGIKWLTSLFGNQYSLVNEDMDYHEQTEVEIWAELRQEQIYKVDNLINDQLIIISKAHKECDTQGIKDACEGLKLLCESKNILENT